MWTATPRWRWACWGPKACWAQSWCWGWPLPLAGAGAGRGAGWRIGTNDLRAQCDALPTLQKLLQACLLVRLHQQTLAAACQRYHLIAPRLARWLLMSQDRSRTESFHLTQEFMALMLGVRRVG